MVSAPVGRVVSRGVTHEELRPLLAGYAAGTLDEAGCEVVRAHLADGCVACLRDVFDRPVGLPRTPPAPAASPPPEPVAADGARPRRGLRRVAVGLGLMLAALGVWAIGELRGREAAYRDQARSVGARAADLEARVAALERDLEARRRELGEARAEASRQAQAVRDAAEVNAEQRRQLEVTDARADVLTRALRARQRQINRLRAAADARGTLAELLGAPGLEVLPLAAVAPFRDVRGHVLWQPAHETALLYASGLPRLPAGSTYRVRLGLDDGREQAGPSFGPDARGTLALAIRVGPAAERLRAVRVVLEPAGEPVLAGERSH